MISVEIEWVKMEPVIWQVNEHRMIGSLDWKYWLDQQHYSLNAMVK